MADPLETADHFDKAVRSTSAFGGLDAKVDAIDARTGRIEKKVDRIGSTMDRWGGAVVIVAALSSVATSVVGVTLGPAILRALGFVK